MVGAGILPRHQRVMALDHTEPIESWASQVKLLQKVFPLIEDRHVLVIYCRGMDGDCCGTEAFMLLLHPMKKMVSSFQPIHLHCFTGNQYVLEIWLEVFPHTMLLPTWRGRSTPIRLQNTVTSKKDAYFWNLMLLIIQFLAAE